MRLYADLVKGDTDRDKQIQVIAHRGLHAQLEQQPDCAAETLLAWLQQTTQAGLATGNMPANPADLERVLLLHKAKRRSRRGLCTCSTGTARSPAGQRAGTNRQANRNRQADRKGSWGCDTAGNAGSRARDTAGSAPSCTIRRTDRRRPRRHTPSQKCPKGPVHEPPGSADWCSPRRTGAGRPRRQSTKSSFAFYFPPKSGLSSIMGRPDLVNITSGGTRPSFYIGRFSGTSCTILNETTTPSSCSIPQPCTFATIGIN